ncbi:ABC transporter substrate-binding protein [Piscinibacter gummiphilus]|uniref:ABC transporter substrate-binding protein n=1 Tax=Piscinibacter gummiphilus TaxID=946333 RepID=A0ABZ0CXQ1_9BURK|nr:ABC transporter substrate-binding protein [Piscinibacter gummiphilus]WOB09757.1 ABC transporter substrate-binding protein [Piscinibacter gummiphilus]
MHDVRRFVNSSLRLLAAPLLAFSALAAHAANEVVIGQVVPLTGVIAGTGDEYSAGAAAYFASVNAKGGVYGRKIRVVQKDDAYKPEATVAHTKEILEKDNPVALFGYVGTANIAALNKNNILTDNKIALLAPYTGAEELRVPVNPNLFHIRASYPDETAKMVEHLYTLGLRKFAVFYQNDGFGKGGLIGAERALEKLKLKAVATGHYDRTKPDDIDAAAKTIGDAQPDAVIMVAVNKASSALIKKLRDSGNRARLFSISVVNFKELLKNTGDELARGVGISQVMPFPYNMASPVPVVREFHAAMKQYQPTKTVSYASMEGFIAAKVLVEAVKRSRADPSRERILQNLADMRDFDTGGFKVNFGGDNRVGSRFVEVTVIGSGGRLLR